MVFFNLMPRSYFGGRVLLPVQQKKETLDEKGFKTSAHGAPEGKRRGAWFAGGATANGKNSVDFEHLFIKRRHSHTTQKILKNERTSMLSVVVMVSLTL